MGRCSPETQVIAEIMDGIHMPVTTTSITHHSCSVVPEPLVPFPQWQTTQYVPFCHVDYHVRQDSLHVLAYHVFPAKTTVIKTQSIFELT